MNTFAIPQSRLHLPDRPQSRLITGILISLLIHGLLLSLQLGIQGAGLPGLDLPWAERRVQPELTIRLANANQAVVPPEPADKSAQPPPPPDVKAALLPVEPVIQAPALPQPPAWRPSLAPDAVKPVPTVTPGKEKTPSNPPSQPALQEKVHKKVITQSEPKQSPFTVAPASTDNPPAEEPEIAEGPTQAEIKEMPAPEAVPPRLEENQATKEQTLAAQKLALEQSAKIAQEQEAKKLEEAKQQAAAKAKADAEQNALALATLENARRQEETRRQEEAKRREQARATRELELKKQTEEAARAAATALLKQQEEADKQRTEEEAAKRAQALEVQKEAQKLAESKKLEEKKQDEAKAAERQAAELAAQKKAEEAARQQAAEAARQKQADELAAAKEKAERAEKAEKAAQAAAQQRERDRQAAADNSGTATTAGTGKPAQLPGTKGDLISRALEQSRKLDLNLPSPSIPVKPPSGLLDTRRRTFFGRIDKDVGMQMYINNWRQKIERNGSLNYAKSSTEKAHGEPIVVVAVHSDGSVDDVTVVRSSGRRELDDAVRNIVRLNARYSAFAPDLARQYDVVEIRFIWNFDNGLKLLDEVR